jgi:hypothetical protein
MEGGLKTPPFSTLPLDIKIQFEALSLYWIELSHVHKMIFFGNCDKFRIAIPTELA